MKTTQLYKLVGSIGIFGGVLNLVAHILPERSGQPLDLLVNLLLLWVLVALYLYQREAVRLLGLIGYALNSFGLALTVGYLFARTFVLAVFSPALIQQLLLGILGLSVLVSLVIHALGVVIFGVATFRGGVFPKWAAILYMLGFLIAFAAPLFVPLVGFAAEVAISASVIRMSYTLVTGRGVLRQFNLQSDVRALVLRIRRPST